MRSTLFFVAIALLTGAAMFVSSRAFAAPGDPAEELFARAEKEDAELAFAEALAHYDEARAKAPASRLAPRAEARAAELRSHAEGGFVPLAQLEAVRRDPVRANDGRAIDALVRAAESFPEGLVRIEVWVLASEAYAHRLGRPDDAAPLYRRIAGDRRADPLTAKKASRDLAMFLLAKRDYAGASEVARVDAKLASDVARVVRRHYMHFASMGVLALLALGAVTSAARARSRLAKPLRRAAPLVVAYAAYIAIAGGLLAAGYEAGSATPFLGFGAALVPVLMLARAWSAGGSASRGARALRGGVAAAGALGAAFLVLEAVDVAYLEGLGL